MAWCWTGNKPASEPILAFYDRLSSFEWVYLSESRLQASNKKNDGPKAAIAVHLVDGKQQLFRDPIEQMLFHL